jgi:L-asparagine permease
MPRAINSVIGRIALFYVGSVLLLSLLLPHTDYHSGESPFVTFYSRVGLGGIGTVMNLVVITAALSSLNAGMYSTGRILRSMAMNGSAPKILGRMSRHGVPYGGILLTAAFGYVGVVLNAIAPGQAFDIVLNLASLGIIAAWATIIISHLRFYYMTRAGIINRPHFQMPWAPWSGYATLAFLLAVVVLMGFDHPIGSWTVASLVVIIPALVGGWFLARKRVLQIAEERMGFTGVFPVIAARPIQDLFTVSNLEDAIAEEAADAVGDHDGGGRG